MSGMREEEREILVSLGHLEREINLKWTVYTSSRGPRAYPGPRVAQEREIAKPVASLLLLSLRPIEMLVVKGKARGDNAHNGFRNFRRRRLDYV